MKRFAASLLAATALLLPGIAADNAVHSNPPEEEFRLGACFHFGSSATGDVAANLALFEQAGFNIGRDERAWQFVEWKKGELRYFKNGLIERMAARLHDRGSCFINLLCYGHSGYCNGERAPKTPEAIEAFCRYAEFVASETKGLATFHQVWNEWDAHPGTDTLESHREYVKLLAAVAPRVRAVDPGAKIMSTSATMNYKLENLLKAGVLQHVDALALNPYVSWRGRGKDTVEFWYELMGKMEQTIRQYNHGEPFPVYITEIGWPAGMTEQGFTEATQAVYAAQLLCSIRTFPFVKGLLWYDFQNDNSLPEDPEANLGLIRADTTPKPVFYVFADLSDLVRNGKFVRRIDAGDPKVWILHYQLHGDDVYAMWNYYPDRNTEIILRNNADSPSPVSVRHAGRPAVTMQWGRRDWLRKQPRRENELAFTLRGMPLLVRGALSQVSLAGAESVRFPRELPQTKQP